MTKGLTALNVFALAGRCEAGQRGSLLLRGMHMAVAIISENIQQNTEWQQLTKSRVRGNAGIFIIRSEVGIERVCLSKDSIGIVDSDSWSTGERQAAISEVDTLNDAVSKLCEQLSNGNLRSICFSANLAGD
jgi:hypothetical protein